MKFRIGCQDCLESGKVHETDIDITDMSGPAIEEECFEVVCGDSAYYSEEEIEGHVVRYFPTLEDWIEISERQEVVP